ncbi:unnamed protein product [Spodoptera exigua]|uniref:Major facilitator superfamily (MFS) profile domain-containing protein n=1 Tax=Spodoptera exigua TaxID=7107 RepID=A0A922M936_SPOEX|nr:hypothetical protein HF086_006588 [Spodoptera exigua]CAH0668647.1 unnamed protein product [Spodoptera exigua]
MTSSGTKGHTRVQWAITILCNLTVFTYGLQCGWMSPATVLLQSHNSPTGRPLSTSEVSWVASSASLAGVLGAFVFIKTVDRFGRKMGILVMTVLQALVWIVKLLPASTTTLIVARVFSGMAGAGCFHVVPMYVKEIAQDSIRGSLSSVAALAQSIGILVMFLMGGFLDYYTVLWIVVGLPIVTFGMLLKAPESPSYLVKVGKTEEATRVLAFLRGLDVEDKEIQNEIDVLKREDEYYKSMPSISMATVFKTKPWRKACIIMILVILVHAFNGSFSVLNYTATLLQDSGMNISPELQSLSIPIFMTLGSIVTIITIDKLGRKLILGSSFAATALAFACMATSSVLKMYGWMAPAWINVTMMMVLICCYGGGVCPLPFIVMAELFNFQIRAKLMGYLVMLAWFTSFIQLVIFSELTSRYGAHVSFCMFVVINVLATALVLLVLPETKGKSIEELEKELTEGRRRKCVTMS